MSCKEVDEKCWAFGIKTTIIFRIDSKQNQSFNVDISPKWFKMLVTFVGNSLAIEKCLIK